MLMEYAIAKAKQAGCYKLQLLSSVKRREAPRFYKAMGFKTSAYGFRKYL